MRWCNPSIWAPSTCSTNRDLEDWGGHRSRSRSRSWAWAATIASAEEREDETRMFEAEDVHSYYGGAHVLQGVSLRVPEGTVVALLGRNGVGKTSFIRSAIGMTPPAVRGGSIRYRDQELLGKSSYRIAGLGIGLVPQGRRIFRSLTVVENLTMAAHEDKSGQLPVGKSWDLDRVWEVF